MMMRILTLLLGIILRGDGEKYITAFRLGLPQSPGKSPLTKQRESLCVAINVLDRDFLL